MADESHTGLSIWTIGHSTRPIEEFIGLLQAHGIRQLADVRTVPRSRHNPQFNKENLPASLQAAGISYQHFHALGGLRRTRPDSINTGWRNASFRGYADYMQTPQFEQALEELIEVAKRAPTAIMCAEAVPWRCHRSLIGDALLVRSIAVLDVLNAKEAKPHSLTPFANVNGTQIAYPGADDKGNLKLEFDGPEAVR
ncbi:MAG TPA: DUF488 domain-containing protein [Bryobacteraceae bacterium]|nr:DUF488 domain-containing protein [Bryobacteraceae bacterium]